MATNRVDPLEAAHLSYLRGDKARAREIVEEYLIAVPDDAEAVELRDRIERDMVEDTLAHPDETGAAFVEAPSYWAIVGALLVGLAMTTAGAWLAAGTMRLGLQIGFSTEVQGRGGHQPVHIGLLPAVIFLIGGLAELWYSVGMLRYRLAK